jgi:hypothetical protein
VPTRDQPLASVAPRLVLRCVVHVSLSSTAQGSVSLCCEGMNRFLNIGRRSVRRNTGSSTLEVCMTTLTNQRNLIHSRLQGSNTISILAARVGCREASSDFHDNQSKKPPSERRPLIVISSLNICCKHRQLMLLDGAIYLHMMCSTYPAMKRIRRAI